MRYWLSSKRMTIQVVADRPQPEGAIVTKAPPIARKFIGQPLSHLIAWMEKQGDFQMEMLS